MIKKNNSLMQKVNPEDFGMILNAIIHFSKEGIFVADDNGDVVLVNEASANLNGLPIKELLHKNVHDLVANGYCERSATIEVLKTKKTVSLINITKDNKKILTTGIPVFDESDNIKFVFVNERDITLLNKLSRMLEKNKLPEDQDHINFLNSSLVKEILKDYIFESNDMYIVVQTAIQAAEFDMDVIITGESGVGKGVIANLIHKLSDRREGPFADINCGAIAGNLLESELFGYAEGAFTGARRKGKIGYFESAHKGSLFLDEIGEIPLPLQVKLLKFLENKEIIRVGSVTPKKIDTRIIAATNKDLETQVKIGQFRKDLYFRLNVIPIHIPPLRKRKSDIEPLINFFLDKFNSKYNVNKTVSRETVDALTEYHYPGNVRELENLFKRLVTMSRSNVIELSDLPEAILKAIDHDFGQEILSGKALQDAVMKYEAKLILEAIDKYGSQRKAAQKLGMDQSSLSRKLKKLTSPKLIHK
ncbi:MAG: sigma 54-interacting transcriptional regulator [Desulfobacterales bacterium]|nr:sigma 54-interacting transcriptional regulator [Desulfobacterales bacterium]